jgi:coatomer subunit beta
LVDDGEFDDFDDISKALGSSIPRQNASRLNRIYQLTGFADPVYAEARLNVLEFDIILDIYMVNQTQKTLQNLTIELHTSGDLKVVDRPQTFTLAPNGTQRMKTAIKVSSTDSGIIFGNLVYDSSNGVEKNFVVLNNIHMDVMDYIIPSDVDDMKYRHMWAEFEWENKVAVNTDITNLNQYLTHITKITNMKCQTPQVQEMSTSNFLAANLYAKTMFGEDALLNLSVEKHSETGKITGYIRIRSKTQGIALSLGDKITSKQRIPDYR